MEIRVTEKIQVGDWVKINGCGPYEVISIRESEPHLLNIRLENLQLDLHLSLWVFPEWCVKVENPWQPEPGTIWLDVDGRVYQISDEGEVIHLTRNSQTMYIPPQHPMTELVRTTLPTLLRSENE